MALLERDQFLRQLSALLAEARHGRGRLALVVGEAGIGKTSLVDAFCAPPPRASRVLWGACDPLEPPRPFTPVVDIAARVGGELGRALSTANRDAVIEAFLRLAQGGDGASTIVVLDDLHWADDATLDLVGVLGRRVARMPTLVICTYRDHDVRHDHPLRLALGDVPASSVIELRLPPLSVDAVEQLAGGLPGRAAALHAVTGGNPFFVKEALATLGDRVPTTVRDAVLSRVARLSTGARAAVQGASVVGPGAEIRTVLDVADVPRSSIDEAVAAALLELNDGTVSFRHELARRAVLDGIPPAEQAAMHRRALAALRAPVTVDWPRLARHAIAAGDDDAILELAPAAADAAAGLGAHREAAAFLAAAVEVAGALANSERAILLERFAHECSLTDDIPRAITARRLALQIWRDIGDRVREGSCLTDLSLLLWLDGRADEALATARAATAILEAAAPGTMELAWAWAVAAQREVVNGEDDQVTLESAARALELADLVGSERIAVHALTSAGVARIFLGDEAGWTMLEDAVARARAGAFVEEAARALINLIEAARDLRRYQLADGYLAEATTYLEGHDLQLYDHLLRSRIAALDLEAGRWDAAAAQASYLLELGSAANPIRVRALTVLGTLAARRNDGDGSALLDEAVRLAGDDLQDLLTLRAARAEAAWLTGDDATAREESARGLAVGPRELQPWWWSELAFWGWRAGATGPLPHPDERPYWLHASRRFAEAADAWASHGAPYQAALALADSEVEAELRDALRTFNELGARAMAKRVTDRLLSLGALRIARGPRPRTRANPAQLTPRQLEILELMIAGLGNAQIAERLVISPKTVDHHVSAILRKLGAPNRAAASAAARAMGLRGSDLQDREAVSTT